MLVNGLSAIGAFNSKSGNWFVRAAFIPGIDIIRASWLEDMTSQSCGVSLISLGSYPNVAKYDLYFLINSGPGLGVLE